MRVLVTDRCKETCLFIETWVFIASDVLAECFQVFVSHEECANQSGMMDVQRARLKRKWSSVTKILILVSKLGNETPCPLYAGSQKKGHTLVPFILLI